MNDHPQADAISWTVVITTFNRPSLLKRAIESAVAQTEACEILVVDDASRPDTGEVIAQFPQVTHIRNPVNLGHAASATLGIARARGSWIKYVDDDDFLAPNCLEGMTRAIERARGSGHAPTIVSCAATNLNGQGTPLSTTRRFPLPGPVLLKPSALVKAMMLDQAPLGTPIQVGHCRQAGLDAGGWPVERPYRWQTGDDIEFWIRMAPRGDAIFMPDVLAYRTIWPGNEAVPHRDRLGISLHLKRRLAETIAGDGAVADPPSDIVGYLKLHWGLVALRDGNIATGLELARGGMFNLSSYRHIRRRGRFTDAVKLAHLLK